MNDPFFKKALKKVEDQFGNLNMEEIGMLWAFFRALKDEPQHIVASGWRPKLVEEDVTEKKLK